MLPGKIDGAYHFPRQCLCGGIEFLHFCDGNVAIYSTSHSPAEHFGRYEKNGNGSVNVYMSPVVDGEEEVLAFKVMPHLWFSKFESPDGERTEWCRKKLVVGSVLEAIRNQEVMKVEISIGQEEQQLVRTYYNSHFENLRTETVVKKIGRGD